MNKSQKTVKLHEIYNELSAIQRSEKMTDAQATCFRNFAADFDRLYSEISFDAIKERYENGLGDFHENFAEFQSAQEGSEPLPHMVIINRTAAKKALSKGFGMLVNGERTRIDSQLISELAEGRGFREERTEYSNGNVVSTHYTNVFLELVTDDKFLNLIPKESVTAGYLRIPKVTRANAPIAIGKANNAQITSTDTNFTSILLEPKNIYTLNSYHKDLIRDGGERAINAIWETTRASVTKRIMENMFFGSVENDGQWNGFDNISGSVIFDTSGASISDYSLITKGVNELANKFVDPAAMVTLMHPNTHKSYSNLREYSSSGSYLQQPGQLSTMKYFTNPQIKTDYASAKTRLYMLDPKSAFLALFGSFEMTLEERYADYDHAAALMVFRADFAFRDAENLFIATNIPA